MDFSSFFCPRVGQNFYITSVEIWCMSFRKKKEKKILLMISSVKIIILLYSSSLRVSWEKRRFFNHQDAISVREQAPWWDQEASDQIELCVDTHRGQMLVRLQGTFERYPRSSVRSEDRFIWRCEIYLFFSIWLLYLNPILYMSILFMVLRFDLMHA